MNKKSRKNKRNTIDSHDRRKQRRFMKENEKDKRKGKYKSKKIQEIKMKERRKLNCTCAYKGQCDRKRKSKEKLVKIIEWQ